jgi:alpha-amylase
VEVVKTIRLGGKSLGPVVEYEVRNGSDSLLSAVFGVEFNLAMLAGSDPSRYYRLSDGSNAGLLAEKKVFEEQRELTVVDEWLNLEAALNWTEPAQIWVHPVETVSQSESGFELVFQSAAVIPRWTLKLPPRDAWHVTIAYEARSRVGAGARV